MSQAGNLISSSNLPDNVATTYVTDDGNAVPASNILNVLGGTGAETTGSGDTITINVTAQGYDWSEQNANFNIVKDNGYFCNATLTAQLPSGSSIGDSTIIYVDTTDPVTIQAGVSDYVQVGNTISVINGVAVSNSQGAILELVYKASDNTWHSISSLGVWSVT